MNTKVVMTVVLTALAVMAVVLVVKMVAGPPPPAQLPGGPVAAVQSGPAPEGVGAAPGMIDRGNGTIAPAPGPTLPGGKGKNK